MGHSGWMVEWIPTCNIFCANRLTDRQTDRQTDRHTARELSSHELHRHSLLKAIFRPVLQPCATHRRRSSALRAHTRPITLTPPLPGSCARTAAATRMRRHCGMPHRRSNPCSTAWLHCLLPHPRPVEVQARGRFTSSRCQVHERASIRSSIHPLLPLPTARLPGAAVEKRFVTLKYT